MELELQRLDFQETQIETQRRRTNKRRRRNPNQKIRRRNPNRNTKKQQTIKKEQTGENPNKNHEEGAHEPRSP